MVTQQMIGLHASDVHQNHEGIEGSFSRRKILKDPLVAQTKTLQKNWAVMAVFFVGVHKIPTIGIILWRI